MRISFPFVSCTGNRVDSVEDSKQSLTNKEVHEAKQPQKNETLKAHCNYHEVILMWCKHGCAAK